MAVMIYKARQLKQQPYILHRVKKASVSFIMMVNHRHLEQITLPYLQIIFLENLLYWILII